MFIRLQAAAVKADTEDIKYATLVSGRDAAAAYGEVSELVINVSNMALYLAIQTTCHSLEYHFFTRNAFQLWCNVLPFQTMCHSLEYHFFLY